MKGNNNNGYRQSHHIAQSIGAATTSAAASATSTDLPNNSVQHPSNGHHGRITPNNRTNHDIASAQRYTMTILYKQNDQLQQQNVQLQQQNFQLQQQNANLLFWMQYYYILHQQAQQPPQVVYPLPVTQQAVPLLSSNGQPLYYHAGGDGIDRGGAEEYSPNLLPSASGVGNELGTHKAVVHNPHPSPAQPQPAAATTAVAGIVPLSSQVAGRHGNDFTAYSLPPTQPPQVGGSATTNPAAQATAATTHTTNFASGAAAHLAQPDAVSVYVTAAQAAAAAHPQNTQSQSK